MLKTFNETERLIASGKLLHIAGAQNRLSHLPQGNWIGGSTAYFMAEGGCLENSELLDVIELPFDTFKCRAYETEELPNIVRDAYPNGFSILILPFESNALMRYAQDAANYEGIFLTNILGWIAGTQIDTPWKPIVVNGETREVLKDGAVVLHVSLPPERSAQISYVNAFTADEDGPAITFTKNGFVAYNCLLDGKEASLADYIREHGLETLPLVGNFAGNGINISVRALEGASVRFYAPVFTNVVYRFAKPLPDYAAAQDAQIAAQDGGDTVFACNCILNFLYGALKGKDTGGFYGPITFGEIAWQLFNQTLVYLRIV